MLLMILSMLLTILSMLLSNNKLNGQWTVLDSKFIKSLTRTYMRRRTQRVYKKPLYLLSTVHFSIVNHFSL